MGPTLKPYRQTPPFCGSDWLGDPKRARGQAKLCESGEQVLSGIGQLLFYQLHPPPPPPPLAPQSHCTCSQATCSCRFNMTARLLIDSWSTGSCSSRAPALAMLSLIGSLAYLVQAPASVCRPRANLTAHSCTRSPFPYRAALANRISTGHWMEKEIKEDPKKKKIIIIKEEGDAQILHLIGQAQSSLVGRQHTCITLPFTLHRGAFRCGFTCTQMDLLCELRRGRSWEWSVLGDWMQVSGALWAVRMKYSA